MGSDRDDLTRQVSELTDALAGAEQRRAEAEERWTAGLLNFAGQLEEAFERGRARGWADCARHFGLPLAQGRHRARRHLSAIPGGAAGVAAAAAWRLAGTAKTATSAAGVLVRHTAAHSAAVTGVAAAGVAAAAGVTVALAPPVSHAPATPPVMSRAIPATMPAPPVAPWRPVRAPAGMSVASASPDPSSPPPVPVAAPVASAPVMSAAAPADTPAVPVSVPAPQESIPVSVPAVAAAVAPVASRVRHRLHGLEHAVDGLADPGTYRGHRRRALPVPSVPPSAIPVPTVSLPSVLGGLDGG